MTKLTKRLLVAGLGLTILPFLASCTLTVIAMISAFNELGQHGIADPNRLAELMGHSLMMTFAGIVMSSAGFLVLIAALASHLVSKYDGKTGSS